MTTIRRNVTVPYSAEQMFDLVNAIEDYPAFLPWCERTQVFTRSEQEVTASITLKKGAIRKSFSTRNVIQPGRQIELQLLEGPFKKLHGHWRFIDHGAAGSTVMLEMSFEFSNRLLDLAIGPVFREIVNSLVASFKRRADQLYGAKMG